MIPQRGTAGIAERRPDGAALTPFALGLAKHLAAASGGANLVFSPLSVYAALALLAAGARGRTLQELLAALGARSRDELAALVGAVVRSALADQSRSGGPAVAFATGMWHDATCVILPGFRDAAAKSYKAETRAVDLRNEPEKAVCEINSWVAAATNNLIDSILAPASLQEDTSLVLANAIYFKGRWEKPFDEADKFYRIDGSAAAGVRFMRSRSSQFVSVHDGLKVLQLPYKSPLPRQQYTAAGDQVPRYSMYVFLPDARDGLPDLVARMTSMPGFWRHRLPETRVPIGEFRLPKFKLSFSGSLRRVLRDGMGIRAALDAWQADLSDMAIDNDSGMPLFAYEICHKAVVEVNEEGFEAAAATLMLCGPTCPPGSPPRTVDFVADHSFMFFVVEEVSGTIMFVGHVLDPTKY